MKEKQVGELWANATLICGLTSGKSLCHVGPQPLTLHSEGHSLNLGFLLFHKQTEAKSQAIAELDSAM